MRYPSLDSLAKTLGYIYARTSEPETATPDEIYAAYDRTSTEINKNKAWLRNKLTPLRRYGFVKAIYSSDGRLVKIALTQKGKEAIKTTDFSNTIPSARPTPSAVSATALKPTEDRVVYPYPLLDGNLVHFSLPSRLSKDDAKRIAAFIEGMAIDSTEAVK